ncbi:MAG: DUF5615 family PIN-like protein [Acidimicrobiia bacterium]
MRFLADMGISQRTVEWLRRQGHEALHLREEHLERLPDEEILVKARSEGRTVLTLDLDFGYLLAISGERLPSVIIFRLNDQSSEVVNSRLAELLARCGNEIAAGAVTSVSDTAFRVRRLPIGR